MGADSIPRKPRHSLPRGSTNCHFHIFEDVKKYPVSADRTYTPIPHPLSEYLRIYDPIGLERMVFVNASVYGFDNTVTLDAIAKLGQHRARGIGGISPDIDRRELDRLHAGGMRGARLSTRVKGYGGVDLIEVIARKIGPLGWNLNLHLRNADYAGIESQLMNAASPIVFDHLGGVRGNEGVDAPGFQTLLRVLKGREDCWVKISGWYHVSASGRPDYADIRPMAQALAEARPDRVVFGTNWPHSSGEVNGWYPDDTDLVDVFCDWFPDTGLRQRILVENPVKLYGFPDS